MSDATGVKEQDLSSASSADGKLSNSSSKAINNRSATIFPQAVGGVPLTAAGEWRGFLEFGFAYCFSS
jgi:hypothetical protein